MSLNGILGAINGVSTVRNWRVNRQASLQSFVASNTKGMTGSLKGNEDWSGSFSQYGHTPAHLPGDEVTFLGSIDGVKGVSGNALIDSVEIVIDIESGAIITMNTSLSGNGALALDVAAAVTDTEFPEIFSSIGRKVEIATPSDDPSFVEVPHVRTVTIRLTANNVSFVSSETAGNVNRKKGNLSASLSMSLYAEDNSLSNLILPNSLKSVRVYVESDKFWQFDAILFGGLSDITIDREAAAMIGASLEGNFTGHYNSETEGQIIMPNTTVWWPEDIGD